jgi:hypothetical protein
MTTAIRGNTTARKGNCVVRATNTNNLQAVDSTANATNYNFEFEDNYNAFNSVTFTVPKGQAGIYMIHAGFYCPCTLTTAQYAQAYILLNGDTITVNRILGTGGTSAPYMPKAVIVKRLQEGDTIEGWSYTSVADTMSTSSPGFTTFNVVRLGE